MLSSKKPQIEKYLEPVAEKLSTVNPNILTLLGSIPPILFFVFVLNENYLFALIAFMGSSIDILDGMIAKKYNKVTPFGAFLDSTVDRFGDFLFITAFAFGGIVRWEIIAPLLLFSFLTSYIRSRAGLAAKNHMEFAIGLIERPERYIFLITALVFYIIYPSLRMQGLKIAEIILLVLTFLSLFTVIQRVLHAYKKL